MAHCRCSYGLSHYCPSLLGHLLDRASFYASEPAARDIHSARSAAELSPTCSWPSSIGDEPVGEEDRSGSAVKGLLTIAASSALASTLGSGLVGVSVLCCRRRQPNGIASSRRGGVDRLAHKKFLRRGLRGRRSKSREAGLMAHGKRELDMDDPIPRWKRVA